MSENFTVIELFAGAGGLALGLERAGLKNILAVEVDKYAAATLNKNRPNWNVLHDDVANIDYEGIQADVVAGGFPCQAFSYAGKKLGFEDTRGTLFFEFARCIKEVKPKMFIGENVEGLLRHEKGKTLSVMIEVLSELGYKVQYKVLNAAFYGVPQKRKRLFIIGTLPGYNFLFPDPESKMTTLRSWLSNVPKSEGVSYPDWKKKIMEMVPPGGCWVNLPEDIQKSYLGKSYHSGGGKRGMARRLSFDEPSLTLTTSPHQKQTERCHPVETRPLTVREYARIQTFPDNWKFVGSVSSQYKQIGNAVPVLLAEQVGVAVMRALQGVTTQMHVQRTLEVFSAQLN